MSLGDEKRQADMKVIAHTCGGSAFDGRLGHSVFLVSQPYTSSRRLKLSSAPFLSLNPTMTIL
jgi:hypothetical protein